MQQFLKTADRTVERIVQFGDRHFNAFVLISWMIALAAMIHVASS